MSDDGLLHGTFIIIVIFFSLLLVLVALMSIPLRTRATANTLSIKIKVQGARKTGDQIKASIDFYKGAAKAFGDQNVVFTYKDNAFAADVLLKPEFNYTDTYALFIKPEKFTGRLFCSTQSAGAQCAVPQFIFLSSGSSIDLTDYLFYTGDVAPVNGKVDAGDMSLIMKQLGKTETSTDLNSDGITDVVDYSLALYALSQNAADDPVSLTGALPTSIPSPTPALSATPGISPTPAPSATPAPSPTPAPSATPVPTATPQPSPTSVSAKCHITPPSGYGDPFDLEAGKTSVCGCSEAPFVGKICSTITCKTCVSGTCECAIGMQLPPYTADCTNGGSMTVNKVTSCPN